MAREEELTEYERERQAKIERNKALMERLALAKLASEAGIGGEGDGPGRGRGRGRGRGPRKRTRTESEERTGETELASGEITERVEADVVARHADRATVEDALGV